ncbi:MAG: branched-chain amino acid ABC transporter permease [Anaerolineales bacterium]|nr:branched-chain amino acid ABC transporter permease [Anaerolineales bacterium]MCB9103371.1 branched-chain amino acid ABC transporter permease [Anaerolineales bacterium]
MSLSAATSSPRTRRWQPYLAPLGLFIGLAALPFVVALLSGQSPAGVLANEAGSAKFIQGLLIEIMILAIVALSYDLVLGITGLLSFGHALFFAAGAYLTGVLLKSFGWSLGATLGLVLVSAVLQALLFGVVLPRVKGITFALVTLGLSEVFYIVVQSRELGQYTGADVGLQGVPPPDFLNPTSHRLTFYLVTLIFTFAVYLFYRLFVDSPTGRVCVAIRENENRALMLGYNTFYFKLVVLVIAAITANLAGTLHALYQPVISPNIASLNAMVDILLMTLIGGLGTLTGAPIGAAIFRLLTFFLDRWFGESASFMLGVVYVALVLFVPYGIVGTWQRRGFHLAAGRRWLLGLLTGRGDG